jgi:hypothetical protein
MDAYFYPVVLCTPMTVVLLVMQHSFYAHRYAQLFINLLAGVTAYGIAVAWFVVTREPIGMRLKTRVYRFFGQTRE